MFYLLKHFTWPFSWRNLSQGSMFAVYFKRLLAVALAKAKPQQLSSQNFETALITLTSRKEWKLTFSHLQQFGLRACCFFLYSVRYKSLFWINKSSEKSSVKLRDPLPHLEGILARWFCEVNTSKSCRKNQGKKIYEESYSKLILVCTTNINLKEEGFFPWLSMSWLKLRLYFSLPRVTRFELSLVVKII